MRALDPRLLRRTRAARPLLAVDVAAGVLVAGCVVVQATLLARVVAGAFAGEGLAELRAPLAGLALAFAARGALAWGMDLAGRRAAASILSELRLELTARRMGAHATSTVAAGEVAATAVQGVDALEAHFARHLPQVVLAALVPPAILAWVALIDLESAALLALTVPLVPVFMWLIGRATEEASHARVQALHALSSQFLDVVRGLPTLRALNAASAHGARLARTGEQYRATTIETLRLAFLSGSVLELAATLGVALVAVTAGVRLVGGDLGLQTGLTVLVLAPEVYLPLRRLGAEFHASADGLAVADRLFALLDAPAPPRAPHATAPPRRLPSPAEAAVRLERVSFAYPARPGLVLDRLDLELTPAETVALVGESGAGKSTVAALVLGFLAPTAGRVTAGGVDLAGGDLEAWRRQIAWVPQRPALLRATLADNIRLGDPGASEAAVRRAAALAGADVVAAALPGGYATVLGDGGRAVSLGERRRIGLARALLRDAPLLVLDEPTADLDAASVATVAAAVRDLSGSRTVLAIAHRPELVAHADRIVRLTHGAVAAEPERVGA